MKLFISLKTLTTLTATIATFSSVVVVEAVLSSGCSSFINSLSDASNPLKHCRVYTALGFPELTHAKDHDTEKLQKALTAYCTNNPACTADQYSSVYTNLVKNCAGDMTPENQGSIATVLYMWYLSPAQREAICFLDTDAKSTNGSGTSCVANIFVNHFTRMPAPFPLSLVSPQEQTTSPGQNLTSDYLKMNLLDQYKRNCDVTLGVSASAIVEAYTAANANGGLGASGGAGSAPQMPPPVFGANGASAGLRGLQTGSRGSGSAALTGLIMAVAGAVLFF
ncbi:hypothetical protein BGW38_001876 [Lunasporangiospora selenospora]|uniref:Uncharacterized protein n=1 Tax=Lunasporangiospora selenospora TaxID=979761 RepID=A0A9P6FUZ7_9FUNG|nr:hypothetical protein BGW38_001876 [Lunasporangiospora selenospora]